MPTSLCKISGHIVGTSPSVGFCGESSRSIIYAVQLSMTGCVENIIIMSVNPATHDQDRGGT